MKEKQFLIIPGVKALLASIVFGLLFFLSSFQPVEAQTSDTHYLTPYQTMDMNSIYTGDSTNKFYMMGTPYIYGVIPNNYTSYKQILYNLDGEFSKVSFLVGAIDNCDVQNATMYIYLDGTLVEERSLTKEMITMPIELDTTNAKQLKINFSSEKGYHDVWYGVANVIGEGGHVYKKEMTKKPSYNKTGTYTYTCTCCGHSYKETIPAQKYCNPYLTPYDAYGQIVYKWEENPDNYFTVMGKKYYQGVFASNYTSEKTQLYNLNQQYESVTFTIGHMDGWEMCNGTLYVYTDGGTTPIKTVPLTYDMISETITIDTSDVVQLKILIKAEKGYQDMFYAVYDMKYTAKATKNHAYSSNVTLSPDYGKAGILTKKCDDCGLTYTEVIPPLYHKMSEAAIALSKTSYEYSGKKNSPAVTVTHEGVTLVKGVDYTVSYKNNIEIGKASVTITGKGKFTGSVTKKYTITPKNIANKYKVSLSKTSYIYKGSACKPTVKVTGLVKNKDYKVTYINSYKVGTAQVKITGINKYKGTITKNYSIKLDKLNKLTCISTTASTVKLTWNKVAGATSYKVLYKTASSGSWKTLKQLKGNVYVKSGLNRKQTCYFKVIPCASSDSKTYTGDSVVKSVKVK